MSSVAVYRRGAIAILRRGFATDANAQGVVGGYVVTNADPRNFVTQAALFSGRDLRFIARQPGELTSLVRKVTDSGIALVNSTTATASSDYLLKGGHVTPLNFGDLPFTSFLDVNDRGTISGTTFMTGIAAFASGR